MLVLQQLGQRLRLGPADGVERGRDLLHRREQPVGPVVADRGRGELAHVARAAPGQLRALQLALELLEHRCHHVERDGVEPLDGGGQAPEIRLLHVAEQIGRDLLVERHEDEDGALGGAERGRR